MSADLRAACIEDAARAYYMSEARQHWAPWERVGDNARSAWRDAASRVVDAVLERVAERCEAIVESMGPADPYAPNGWQISHGARTIELRNLAAELREGR